MRQAKVEILNRTPNVIYELCWTKRINCPRKMKKFEMDGLRHTVAGTHTDRDSPILPARHRQIET